MNRKHNIEQYLRTLEKLKDKKNKIKFSSDFIIGYPGEKDEDFNETIILMKKVKFINSYSYIFSARPGTPSAKLEIWCREQNTDKGPRQADGNGTAVPWQLC